VFASDGIYFHSGFPIRNASRICFARGNDRVGKVTGGLHCLNCFSRYATLSGCIGTGRDAPRTSRVCGTSWGKLLTHYFPFPILLIPKFQLGNALFSCFLFFNSLLVAGMPATYTALTVFPDTLRYRDASGQAGMPRGLPAYAGQAGVIC
jgi:hypothetical protein